MEKKQFAFESDHVEAYLLRKSCGEIYCVNSLDKRVMGPIAVYRFEHKREDFDSYMNPINAGLFCSWFWFSSLPVNDWVVVWQWIH